MANVKFSDEQKLGFLDQIDYEGEKPGAVASKNSFHPTLISKWRKALNRPTPKNKRKKKVTPVSQSNPNGDLQRKYNKLLAENQELKDYIITTLIRSK